MNFDNDSDFTRRIMALYQRLDADNSNSLSYDELVAGLKKIPQFFNVHLDVEDFESLVKMYDVDPEVGLTPSQFEKVLRHEVREYVLRQMALAVELSEANDEFVSIILSGLKFVLITLEEMGIKQHTDESRTEETRRKWKALNGGNGSPLGVQGVEYFSTSQTNLHHHRAQESHELSTKVLNKLDEVCMRLTAIEIRQDSLSKQIAEGLHVNPVDSAELRKAEDPTPEAHRTADDLGGREPVEHDLYGIDESEADRISPTASSPISPISRGSSASRLRPMSTYGAAEIKIGEEIRVKRADSRRPLAPLLAADAPPILDRGWHGSIPGQAEDHFQQKPSAPQLLSPPSPHTAAPQPSTESPPEFASYVSQFDVMRLVSNEDMTNATPRQSNTPRTGRDPFLGGLEDRLLNMEQKLKAADAMAAPAGSQAFQRSASSLILRDPEAIDSGLGHGFLYPT
mmetsp:Transcript_4359/g.6908  ORF Transcript_4359/g.6908 Transcript_4359/m.6908 type:complete len:456 (+) Transcript_4359:44-1411(+)